MKIKRFIGFLGILSALAIFLVPLFYYGEQKPKSSTDISYKNSETPIEAITQRHSIRSNLSPAQISRSFLNPFMKPPAGETRKAEPGITPQITVKPIAADQWLKVIGHINDERGIERLYLKNGKTGQLIKIRLDMTEENGVRLIDKTKDTMTISIDNVLYSLSGVR